MKYIIIKNLRKKYIKMGMKNIDELKLSVIDTRYRYDDGFVILFKDIHKYTSIYYKINGCMVIE